LEDIMETYVILRRGAWGSPEDLGVAAGRSKQVGDEEMSEDIRWIRSYVLSEPDGRVGTVCIYQASSPEAIREHASRAELAVDEIIPVADTVIVRADPQAASA
jgi:thiamine biosynthesis protein ThiC